MKNVEYLPNEVLLRVNVNATDGVTINRSRRSGNTTRIVDNVIQQLFSGALVKLCDIPSFENKIQNRHLAKKLFVRLQSEHKSVFDNHLVFYRAGWFVWLEDDKKFA